MQRLNYYILGFGALVLVVAGYLYLDARAAQRNAEQMQDLNLRMQGINPDQPEQRSKTRVFLTMGDCSTDPNLDGEYFTGETARAYCQDPDGDFHPRLENVCFRPALEQARGYGSAPPERTDFRELACGIAQYYPATSDNWEDNTLDDNLRILVTDYLSGN